MFKNIFGILALSVIVGSCSYKKDYVVISGYAQGGTYSVKFNLIGPNGRVNKTPQQIKEGIDSIFNLIDTTLSGYNKGSILTQFNKGKDIVPNQMFKDIYAYAYNYWKETGGKLDVSCAKLYNLWGFGFTKDSLPPDNIIKNLLDSVGMQYLKNQMITRADGLYNAQDLILYKSKDIAKPELNYNAIAQGYSCDVIAKYLYGLGVKDMLVEVGEIYCDGLNPNGMPWAIGVDMPQDGNNTPGKYVEGVWESDGGSHGVVTSGNYRKFYIKNGRKYSHTIDPKTGYPVMHNLLSATIVAPNAISADAYATYCMVIGLEEAQKFIESRHDIEGYLIYDDGKGMKQWASKGFCLRTKNN